MPLAPGVLPVPGVPVVPLITLVPVVTVLPIVVSKISVFENGNIKIHLMRVKKNAVTNL